MADARATFQKLLALATHEATPIDEARTAALKALKLAQREGWQIGVREAPKPQPPAAAKPAPYATAEDVYRATGYDPRQPFPDFAAQYYAWAAAQAGWRPEPAPPPKGKRAAPAHEYTGGFVPRRGTFRTQVAGSGTCATCGETYEAGAPVWYDDVTGQVWHADCRDPPPRAKPNPEPAPRPKPAPAPQPTVGDMMEPCRTCGHEAMHHVHRPGGGDGVCWFSGGSGVPGACLCTGFARAPKRRAG